MMPGELLELIDPSGSLPVTEVSRFNSIPETDQILIFDTWYTLIPHYLVCIDSIRTRVDDKNFVVMRVAPAPPL